VKNNASISKVNEPIRLIKPKPCQEVPWSLISKSCIPKASTTEIEECCNEDSNNGGLFHGLVFWWRRL